MEELDLSCYDPKKWIFTKYLESSHGYWLYEEDQRNPGWRLVRIGRPSGSTCSACVGHSDFTLQDDAALEIVGIKKKEFDEKALNRMNHGVKYENTAREWYEKQYKVNVKEIGYVVPSWDLKIGVSVDGLIIDNDGIIEIKCPQKMYDNLSNHIRLQKMGVNVKGFDHIPISHYDQMQLGMAIMCKSYCDYIVYCTSDESIFCQRIPFNQEYWKTGLYPVLSWFCTDKLQPLLDKYKPGFPLMPSSSG